MNFNFNFNLKFSEEFILKSASIFLMLIFSNTASSQIYTSLTKSKIKIESDEFGELNTKFIVCNNKLVLLNRTKSKKIKKTYYAIYKGYDLITGKKEKIKFIADSPIFEFLNLNNINQNISMDAAFLQVDEYERLNLEEYTTRLYCFNLTKKKHL